ncbi:MAG: DGQHR domain-containing protein [Candidatus Thiodiazotropha sp. (ex Lucinoma kastoroae)]|nr:DGQHR domain-containing protein [Candidatus Thiodiazotropha sp. (ex Lucinoma kastoroae)]
MEQIILPALRGVMGNWVYYSCLMSMGELSERVRYAEEIHNNERLSDMIQRQLKTGRSAQIAKYLETQPERFFNSLVVATYGGQPNWHALSDLKSKSKNDEFQGLTEETVESVGFLTFRGDEKLFALDGQHRLAGIKKAVKEGLESAPYDDVSVIFVAHKENKKGLERTRRLFTTLNKTARPVSKGDIIALDEDDVMSICVRRLIEDTALFSDDRIAFVASNNMPVRNTTSLTTIGNLYDVLSILFTDAKSELKKKKADLQRVRPNDEELDAYFEYSRNYFILLRKNFKELEKYFASKNTDAVVQKFRGSHGGNALFRPIGLEIFVRIIARLTKDMPLEEAIELASKLPRDLNKAPYEGLMWDSNKKTILNSHKVTLREILLYMVTGKSKYKEAILLERYRKDTGDELAVLPEKIL